MEIIIIKIESNDTKENADLENQDMKNAEEEKNKQEFSEDKNNNFGYLKVNSKVN